MLTSRLGCAIAAGAATASSCLQEELRRISKKTNSPSRRAQRPASRYAASADPSRAVCARADLAGVDVVRAAQSCRPGRWRSQPAALTSAQCAAGPADVHGENERMAGLPQRRPRARTWPTSVACSRRATWWIDRSIQNTIVRACAGCSFPLDGQGAPPDLPAEGSRIVRTILSNY